MVSKVLERSYFLWGKSAKFDMLDCMFIFYMEKKKYQKESYSVRSVIILLNCKLNSFDADLQDTEGRWVELDCHSSVVGNLRDMIMIYLIILLRNSSQISS